MRYIKQVILATAMMSLTACTTTGNVEEKAAIGAAAGALTGAVIGNNVGDGDAGTGAAIGAVVGGVGGAYVGREKDKAMGEPTRIRQPADGQKLYYEEQTGRYFFVDEATGRTYYRNGEYRG